MSEQNTLASDSLETHVTHGSAKRAETGFSACSPPATTASTTILSILDIPHILLAVRALLPMNSIRFCCLVSHDFHELFIPGLWRRLEVGFTIQDNSYGGHPRGSFLQAIALYGHHVRHLSFVAHLTRTIYFFRGTRTKQTSFAKKDTTLQSSPSPSNITWRESVQMKVSWMLTSRPRNQKIPYEEKKRSPSTSAHAVTMAQSPIPIATLGREDPRREGRTAELFPNLSSLQVEISPRMGRGWIIQETELVLLFVARNQGLRSLTIDLFPTRSQTMVALFFRVLGEQAGLQELKLWRGQEVSGGLFKALLLNLPRAPRAGQGHNERPKGSSSLRLLEVKWSIDDDKYTEGYWSHGEWHAHDPNHPDRIQAPTLEEGPDGPASALWPIYSSLRVVRFLGNLRGSEDNILIPFLKTACLNLTELHCHNVQAEKHEAIRQATRAPICCFEDENDCISNVISSV